MTPDEAAEMWAGIKAGDLAMREKAILHYYPLVGRIAGKMCRSLPQHVDPDDIVSFGTLGLIRAVGNYNYGIVSFETFAAASIRGVILDELRALDWAPRSLRKRQRDLDRAVTGLEAENGIAPQDGEVAEKLGWEVSDISKTRFQTEGSHWKSLDEPADAMGRSKYDTICDVDDTPEVLQRSQSVVEKMTQFIEELPPQERLVVTLYYFIGLRLAEVGEVLGVPESRASQVHTRAMLQVRQRLVDLLG